MIGNQKWNKWHWYLVCIFN